MANSNGGSMSAQVFKSTCRFCKGSGKAESLMEVDECGDWHANKTMPHQVADSLISSGITTLRWEDCDCPICGGEGQYELEAIPCKIF
jgi:hypothetical protein